MVLTRKQPVPSDSSISSLESQNMNVSEQFMKPPTLKRARSISSVDFMENPIIVAKKPKARVVGASSSSAAIVPDEVKIAHESLFGKRSPFLDPYSKSKAEKLSPEQEALLAIFNEDSDHNTFALRSLELCDGRYADTILQEKFRKENCVRFEKGIFTWLQKELNANSYGRLYRFMFEIYEHQNLHPATFVRALHIFDHVIARRAVRKPMLALVVCACIMLASKLEEIYPPCVDTVLEFTKHTFSREDLFTMERKIFEVLCFDISFPTRYEFATYFCRIANLTEMQYHLYMYLIMLSFLDYNLHYFKASQVAAAALHLTLQITRHNSSSSPIWTQSLRMHTGCDESQLIDVILRLRAVHWNATSSTFLVTNLIEHYSTTDKMQVTELCALSYSYLSFVVDSNHLKHNLPKLERDLVLVDYAHKIQDNAIGVKGPSREIIVLE